MKKEDYNIENVMKYVRDVVARETEGYDKGLEELDKAIAECKCNRGKHCAEHCEEVVVGVPEITIAEVSQQTSVHNAKNEKALIHKYICEKIQRLYLRKNNDYGDSVKDTFDKFGLDAFLVRMYDKINRVYSLTRPNVEQTVMDEKIEDTLLDLANYAIIALTELQYKKQFEDSKTH